MIQILILIPLIKKNQEWSVFVIFLGNEIFKILEFALFFKKHSYKCIKSFLIGFQLIEIILLWEFKIDLSVLTTHVVLFAILLEVLSLGNTIAKKLISL